MKKILLSAVLVGSLFAQEEDFIEVGIGYESSKDNFSTSSQSNINSFSNAKKENEVFGLINFNYAYSVNEKTNIYIGSGYENLYLGSEFETKLGLFDIGLTFNIGDEEWQNPFDINENRKKTDVDEVGMYVGYSFELSESFQSKLLYSYSKRSYDTETVQEDLKRDGNRHVITLDNSYTTNVFDKEVTFLIDGSYEQYNAQGASSNYDYYSVGLGISSDIINNINFTFLTNNGRKKYDKSNSVFDKRVDSTTNSVVGIFKFNDYFGYENFYVTVTSGLEKEDSNVNFYNKENIFALLSIGYKF